MSFLAGKADTVTPGLQAASIVPLNGSPKASLVIAMRDVTSVSARAPSRCRFDVKVVPREKE